MRSGTDRDYRDVGRAVPAPLSDCCAPFGCSHRRNASATRCADAHARVEAHVALPPRRDRRSCSRSPRRTWPRRCTTSRARRTPRPRPGRLRSRRALRDAQRRSRALQRALRPATQRTDRATSSSIWSRC